MSKRNIIVSFVLSFLWLLLLAGLKSSSATFRPELKDHISNIHSAILFGYRGMDIYTKPIAASSDGVVRASEGYLEKFHWLSSEVIQLKERELKEPLLVVWPSIPRPYPPGLWVLLSPFAALTDVIGRLAPITVYALVFVVLLCAHFCFFLIWKSVRNQLGTVGSVLAAIVLYNEIVGWSLCSQLDAISLLIFIWCLFAFENKDFWGFFSRFAVVSLVQYRVLFFLPLFFIKLSKVPLRHLYQTFKNQKTLTKVILLLSGVGLAASALIFTMVLDSIRFQGDLNNPLHYERWFVAWQGPQWLFFVLFIALIAWFLKTKEYLLLSLTLWWVAFFSSMSFVRGWYVLFLLPVLLLSKKHPWRSLALYAVFATAFFSSFPLDLWLPRMVLNRILSGI